MWLEHRCSDVARVSSTRAPSAVRSRSPRKTPPRQIDPPSAVERQRELRPASHALRRRISHAHDPAGDLGIGFHSPLGDPSAAAMSRRSPPASSVMRRLYVVATTIVLSGCAATQPTPAQERAYGHIAECSRATSYAVNPYVDANGRIRLGEGAPGRSLAVEAMYARALWLSLSG